MPQDQSPGTQFSVLPRRLRLDYLDGIRALAALYVCLFHAVLTSIWSGGYHQLPPDVPDGVRRMTRPFMFGHFGVSVFIILSGYCLMLPVTRRGDGCLPGGVMAFLWRRTRRLLPPYYIALGIALLVALLPGMNHPTGTRWDETMPVWNRGSILSHLLLIQNWNADWLFKILAPAWSVAPEWQIYWLFPFAILPLMRRVGIVPTTMIALTLGLIVHSVFRGHYDFVSSGYVGLFVMGMLGAEISFSEAPWFVVFRQRLPWGVMSALIWLGFVLIAQARGAEWMEDRHWWADPVVGFATVCLLIYGAHVCTTETTTPNLSIPRVLQAKPLVQIGGFSYSLYLTHDLILNLLHMALRPAAFGYGTTLCIMLALGIPLCLVGAYGFHLVFERPFMSGRSRAVKPQLCDAHPVASNAVRT